ncbi:ATP-dependent DNA helicase Q-like 1 [Dendronephthya gigantea]|uniref:ATP-dependent DNA helicase Q-like 1 n=1 Tax=Dendronephthya gigantea TaxID=151771 RepID=UPI00106D4592|nr:ATP-dependent DNA helicase Q-like 1 [Dendronephthya gigantea]
MGFLSCLHTAINKSVIYNNINLKPKQVKCLEALYKKKDCVAVLPTGYGKSLIYQLLPSLLNERNTFEQIRLGRELSHNTPVILVVSPLNSLICDQLRKLNNGADLKAVFLKKDSTSFCEAPDIKDALFDIMFLHPEACLSSKTGMDLFQSSPYQKSVEVIVVDEAHCILEWGDNFRTDYSYLGMLCSLFPSVPVLALTATASKKDREVIKSTLHMRNPLEVVGS